ncbi:MAG TPA: SH3 domain-containing protein [Burkholderiales bacterium]|nr:SH3 domain-containing protein [Burkholderiales bacterium]
MQYARHIGRLLVACACACVTTAVAVEFRAVTDSAAVLYDAPSITAKKLYVVNHGYPLEVVVQVASWTKVRDASGGLSWIESKELTDKRTVMVKVPLAQVRQTMDDNAPVVFQAQQNVILDLVAPGDGAWLQVRHEDGATGYIKATQVWGS